MLGHRADFFLFCLLFFMDKYFRKNEKNNIFAVKNILKTIFYVPKISIIK